MARRADLSGFTGVDRQALVDLIMPYLTDAVVAAHTTITHSGEHLFTGHRAYIADLEASIAARGGGRFVPLPKWNPATPIPPEFNVAKPQDDGTPRPALVNLNPNRPTPSQFLPPAVCNYRNAADFGNAANPWHGGVHITVGGTMLDGQIASAAPIFWCWHAWIDDLYDDYLLCGSARGWSDIKAVPGWFGWENQGAGIALADTHGHGPHDLVVFQVDNPGGENHGYYRLGRHFDTQGSVTGGWTDIKPVPDWFGSEDQGADIAVADISANGNPDLLVFHVDNPGGDNHGYYRIGWNLDSSGNVAGWSDIKAVPDWFGWENQGAGIALSDLSGNGRPDLLVFHVDNPEGDNHGYYRIGWNLDSSGNVAAWSDIKAVPDWFGWENQGAGVALADINGTGRPDLFIFHLDNPAGDNHGYYRIGWNLSTTGDVS